MAVDTIKNIVIMREPDLASDTRIDDFITLAETEYSEAALGDMYNNIVALKVLHMMVMAGRGGIGGAIAGEKEGDLSISYNTGAFTGDLDSTSYGMELKKLIKTTVITPNIF